MVSAVQYLIKLVLSLISLMYNDIETLNGSYVFYILF